MGLQLHQYNARTQAAISAALEQQYRKTGSIPIAPVPHQPAKKRIRQNSAGLNKTEAAFLAHLQSTYPHPATIHREPTLPLANGCKYRADFMVTVEVLKSGGISTCTVVVFEVKGFARDDSIVKLKVAASVYRNWKFRLVTKRKDGGWDFQEVLP